MWYVYDCWVIDIMIVGISLVWGVYARIDNIDGGLWYNLVILARLCDFSSE